MKKSAFQQFMEKGAVLTLVLSIAFLCCLLIFGGEPWISLLITFVTIFFHFSVRLTVGAIVDKAAEKGIDHNARWFKQNGFEVKMYHFMKVKRWKLKLPTYAPDNFSLEKNSAEQVVVNMCGAELVHEINIVASFVPVVLSIAVPFLRDTLIVFVITSIVAALFDLLFVMIQRYNRPRMVRLIQRRDNNIKTHQ